MSDDDDEPGLTDDDIEKLQKIKDKNSEVGANEFTMGEDDDRGEED